MDFDLKRMKRRCLMPAAEFGEDGVDIINGPPYLFFKDNGAKVLAVAHLDSVQKTTHFDTVTIREGKNVFHRLVFNGQLDDRLGVYLILDYLPACGLKYDILLTDDEERCGSTAMFFMPPHQYNWMFSFDREGSDVVTYSYDTKQLEKALTTAGFRISAGSYSDICELEHLGCCGLNVGTGLSQGHSELSHADLIVLRRQVAKFNRFYQANKDIHIPWKPSSKTSGYGRRWWSPSASKGKPQDPSSMRSCHGCRKLYPTDMLWDGYCDDCLDDMYEECQACGSMVESNEIHDAGNWGRVCGDCYDDLKDCDML